VASARITSGYAQPSHWSNLYQHRNRLAPQGVVSLDAENGIERANFTPATSLFKAIFIAKAVKSDAFTSCR